MQREAIQKILGLFLMVFSFAMLAPICVSYLYQDGAANGFITAFILLSLLGFVMWYPVRFFRRELRLRDGFVIVAMFWIALSLAGALPLVISERPHLSLTNAVFEAASGLSTTGATTIVGLDNLPKSILFYRQELQLLGGMGMVVLAVAVLPMLGIGGMQLYRAETPGPVKDNKLTPRITETAKALWYIYLGLTVACALAYYLAGMTAFDAIGHSFSTLSTGGLSTHDASIAYFNSPMIEGITVLFMFLGGVNFSLHFLAWRKVSLRAYIADDEFRVYLGILIFFTSVTAGYLYFAGTYGDPLTAFRYAIFQVVSITTSTGYTTADFSQWPGLLPALIIFSSFIGGCAASTSGGMKVVRVMLLVKQGMREVTRLIHPSAQVPVKIGGWPVEDRIIEAVWGFFSLYMVSYIVMSMVLAATGIDLVTSFSAVAMCINNAGPGLGQVASNYSNINDIAKWVLAFAMIVGRLEVFTIFVLLTPAFWRR
jgi:trk system potassium uptake protein TrkH